MLKNNKGVTLIELLVVIVILGIIATISTIAIGNIIDNAQKDAVLSNAGTLVNAADSHCLQNIANNECTGEAGFVSGMPWTGAWTTGWTTLSLSSNFSGSYAVYRVDKDSPWQVIYIDDIAGGWYVDMVNPFTATRGSVSEFDPDAEPMVPVWYDVDGDPWTLTTTTPE